MSISEKRAAKERLQQLIAEQGHGDARQTILSAYKLKHDFLVEDRNHKQLMKDHCVIRSLDPLIIPPQKKFEHCPGARISPNANHSILSHTKDNLHRIRAAPVHQQTSKEQPPSSSQRIFSKLSAVESFPSVYRSKFDDQAHDISGDYIENPRQAAKMLKSTSSSSLNIPGRSADFNSEVQWRMLLRNTDS